MVVASAAEPLRRAARISAVNASGVRSRWPMILELYRWSEAVPALRLLAAEPRSGSWVEKCRSIRAHLGSRVPWRPERRGERQVYGRQRRKVKF